MTIKFSGHAKRRAKLYKIPETIVKEISKNTNLTDGEHEINVDMHTGVVAGKFPKRALHHVLEWYELHKDELLKDWDLCRHQRMPEPIEPLE